MKLYLGPLAGELAAELPFTLMHPKPEPEPERKNSFSDKKSSSPTQNGNTDDAGHVPSKTVYIFYIDAINTNQLTQMFLFDVVMIREVKWEVPIKVSN